MQMLLWPLLIVKLIRSRFTLMRNYIYNLIYFWNYKFLFLNIWCPFQSEKLPDFNDLLVNVIEFRTIEFFPPAESLGIKVARSDFRVTIPFNFERLEHHHDQSDKKSNVSGVLEKVESFKWDTFRQDLNYHSNEMTPCLILHKTE